jgi:hypothetical protein
MAGSSPHYRHHSHSDGGRSAHCWGSCAYGAATRPYRPPPPHPVTPTHGVLCVIKGVERLGRPHRFLDAVPHVDNRPGSGYAVGSRSDSAFRQCVLHTSMRIVPPSEAFLKLRFFDWLQSSSSWGVAPPAISSHDWRCTRPLGVIGLAMRRHSLTKPV